MMNMPGRRTAYLLLLGCLAGAAQAGTVIQQQELQPGGSQARQQVTIYVDAGKLRVEGENPGSGKYALIFDQAKQVTWMADLGKGTYMEFTAAQVQGMANQMQSAMRQMEAEMANMPPDQRAMMEQMMKGRMGAMGGGAAPPKTVREKAQGVKVGAFPPRQLDSPEWPEPDSRLPGADHQLRGPAAHQRVEAGQYREPVAGCGLVHAAGRFEENRDALNAGDAAARDVTDPLSLVSSLLGRMGAG